MGRPRTFQSPLSARPVHAPPAAELVALLVGLVIRAQRQHGGPVRAAQVLEIANIDERAQLPLFKFGARAFGHLLVRAIGIESGGFRISSHSYGGAGAYRVIEARK
jgi:hypothetical protein